MPLHSEFLRFSAVISHCYRQRRAKSLLEAVKYGQATGLINEQDNLSSYGRLVGNILILKATGQRSDYHSVM